MTPARQLGTSVTACLAGAGLALYAATRTWSVEVTERPGLSDLRATTTGAAHEPWLAGLALVALAGAGALLATRGLPRRLVGVLLAAAGAAVAVGAVAGRATLDPGAAGAAATIWPFACTIGGAAIVVGGLAAARHGRLWPTMGSRYDRSAAPPPPAQPGGDTGPSPAAGPAPHPLDNPLDTQAAWNALDRGIDPTDR
jgi:uncharacterized membrane protein (TIGR02234 family)